MVYSSLIYTPGLTIYILYDKTFLWQWAVTSRRKTLVLMLKKVGVQKDSRARFGRRLTAIFLKQGSRIL